VTKHRTSHPVGRSQAASILLVEDNPADALPVEEALNEHQIPFCLVVLGDGEKAIQFLEEFDAITVSYPKLVILDLNCRSAAEETCSRASDDVPNGITFRS
jgi:CheY-like chemotaxis protein